jgi:pilus assembly protein CpaE
VEVIIASNNQVLAARVRDALSKAGIECSLTGVLSHDSAPAAVMARPAGTLTAVLFCSQAFSADDVATVKQLAAAAGDGTRVVAVGPVSDPNVVLRIIRNGAIDVLDVNDRFDSEVAELFERFKSARTESKATGKLLTVVGTVGGSGASLLACNLAVAIAQQGRTCELLDLQMRGGDQTKLLQVAPLHNLSSLATKIQQLDASMFEQSLIRHESGVRLLPSPEPFTDYRQFSPQVIQKVLTYARASCEYVVVDLEDAEHAEQVRTLAVSDQIIMPVRPDLISLYRTQKCLEYLTRAQVSREKISIVANRVGQPRELPVARMAEVLEMPIVCQIPDDAAAVNTSVNLGVPLILSAPTSRSSRCILQLAEHLTSAEPAADGARQFGWWAQACSSWLPRLNPLSPARS